MLHKVPPTTVLSKLPLPSTDFDLPILYQDLSYSVLAIIIIGKKRGRFLNYNWQIDLSAGQDAQRLF
jgi:hypothetical protein